MVRVKGGIVGVPAMRKRCRSISGCGNILVGVQMEASSTQHVFKHIVQILYSLPCFGVQRASLNCVVS